MQIEAIEADITTLDVDAANSSLPGGGVDYSDADPSLYRERLAAAR